MQNKSSTLPVKHLTELKIVLEMSLFKEELLQRDNDQSLHKFPKDMGICAQKGFTPNANNECLVTGIYLLYNTHYVCKMS